MKIRKLETFTNEFVGFVRVTAEDGSTGWGQLSTYNADITAAVFHRQVAPWALGRGIMDLDDMVGEIARREHKFNCSYLYRAMSGLDTALWDLRGRLEEKPVVSLIGGEPGRLRAYASSMRRDITPEDEAIRFQRLRDAYGFDAFKFRDRMSPCWSMRTPATRRPAPWKWAACSSRTASSITRSPVPIGRWSRRVRSPRPCRST